MKFAYLGERKFIIRNDRLYCINERSQDAAIQAEWADNVLKRPNVQYQNDRWSHDAATEILERSEYVLTEYLVETV